MTYSWLSLCTARVSGHMWWRRNVQLKLVSKTHSVTPSKATYCSVRKALYDIQEISSLCSFVWTWKSAVATSSTGGGGSNVWSKPLNTLAIFQSWLNVLVHYAMVQLTMISMLKRCLHWHNWYRKAQASGSWHQLLTTCLLHEPQHELFCSSDVSERFTQQHSFVHLNV